MKHLRQINPQCILIYSNTAWSIFNFRRNLIRTLLAAGHDVIAIAPPDEYVQKITDLGCRYIALPMDNRGTSIWRDLRLLFRIRKHLKQTRADIAFTFTIKCNIYTSFAASFLPTAVVPNVSGLGAAFEKSGWLNRLVLHLYRFAFRRTKTVFFQNRDDMKLFRNRKLVTAKQAHLLPGSGVDLSYFAPATLPNQNTVTFLLPARLLWDKGIAEFAAAAKSIKAKYPGTKFQLLGFLEPEGRCAIPSKTIEQWVHEGTLDYLGATGDIRPFFARADCIVLPSYYREGTPRTLLEAASMARPIITTDMPGCRDTIIDQQTGFLCQPKNSADLAQKMATMIELGQGGRKKLGQSGRRLMSQNFSEKIVLDAYLGVLMCNPEKERR